MRFRGKIVDIGCIHHFSRVVNTMTKLAKDCTLRLTTTKLYFILSERVVTGGVSIWCELAQAHFFNEYNLAGMSDEFNEIFLSLVPEDLDKCLKSAQNAKSVKLKLSKKERTCLTFEIELPSLSRYARIVTHDVYVRVIPLREWHEHEEPEMPKFDVSVYMPPLKMLRNIVDKMKNIDHFMTISANHSGEMALQVETDLATVTTHFKDLEYPAWSADRGEDGDGESPAEPDPAQFYCARIDIRKFAMFLVGQQVNPVKVICNLVDGKLAHFYLLHEDVSLQYLLPTVHT